MGAWGYKALDSDEGFEVVDFLEENIPKGYNLKLSKVISSMKGDLLGENPKEIDFLYDNTAIALAELYFIFKDKGKFKYKNEDDNTKSLSNIISFTANENSLKYLLRLLKDIESNISEEDEKREIIVLWKDSKNWKKWENNLKKLIQRITDEIK